jgi:MerR family regulatory protein
MDRMTALLSIGELASRTGLSVRTIRFYSDSGVVSPAERSDAGYRQSQPNMQAAAALVAEKAGAAQHLAPDSPEAQAVVDELLPAFGSDIDRAQLADRLATGTNARAERYWQLLAIVNGWPPVPTTVPAWEWLIAALRA